MYNGLMNTIDDITSIQESNSEKIYEFIENGEDIPLELLDNFDTLSLLYSLLNYGLMHNSDKIHFMSTTKIYHDNGKNYLNVLLIILEKNLIQEQEYFNTDIPSRYIHHRGYFPLYIIDILSNIIEFASTYHENDLRLFISQLDKIHSLARYVKMNNYKLFKLCIDKKLFDLACYLHEISCIPEEITMKKILFKNIPSESFRMLLPQYAELVSNDNAGVRIISIIMSHLVDLKDRNL